MAGAPTALGVRYALGLHVTAWQQSRAKRFRSRTEALTDSVHAVAANFEIALLRAMPASTTASSTTRDGLLLYLSDGADSSTATSTDEVKES